MNCNISQNLHQNCKLSPMFKACLDASILLTLKPDGQGAASGVGGRGGCIALHFRAVPFVLSSVVHFGLLPQVKLAKSQILINMKHIKNSLPFHFVINYKLPNLVKIWPPSSSQSYFWEELGGICTSPRATFIYSSRNSIFKP